MRPTAESSWGGQSAPPFPEPTYFKPIGEILDRLEAAVREFGKAEAAKKDAHQYHRVLGDQIFMECQEGSVALPRVRGREDTFVDLTGQEWARARPTAEEAPESRSSAPSSEGPPSSPARADPRRAEQSG